MDETGLYKRLKSHHTCPPSSIKGCGSVVNTPQADPQDINHQQHQKWLQFSTVSDVFPAAGTILCYCKIPSNVNSPSVRKSAAETRRRRREKWAKPLQQSPREESNLPLQHGKPPQQICWCRGIAWEKDLTAPQVLCNLSHCTFFFKS